MKTFDLVAVAPSATFISNSKLGEYRVSKYAGPEKSKNRKQLDRRMYTHRAFTKFRGKNGKKQCRKFKILREINFGHFDAPKTAILTIRAALNLKFWTFFIISSVNFF